MATDSALYRRKSNAKFKLDKIINKYLIIQIFSYASEQDLVMCYVPFISKSYRQLFIENYIALAKIVTCWKKAVMSESVLIKSEELVKLI